MAILAGVLLVLAEVVSSQVLLSQIGNFLIWSGSAVFAWLLVRGEVGAPAGQVQARRARCWLAQYSRPLLVLMRSSIARWRRF